MSEHKNISIGKIPITINNETIELTLSEVKELHETLSELLNLPPQQIKEYYPWPITQPNIPDPINPFNPLSPIFSDDEGTDKFPLFPPYCVGDDLTWRIGDNLTWKATC